MRKTENLQMESIVGGDWACDYTLAALYSFGGPALFIPGLQIVGGVSLVIGLGLLAGGACGY